MPETAAIALGSNLGDRRANLEAGIASVRRFGSVKAVSSFFDTAPVGYVDQPRFLNAALLLETELSPIDLLRALLQIEREMGRDRAAVAEKGPRTIDLDLIFHGKSVVATAELTLPHPAMQEREFVLAPLAEIAPAWLHPRLGRSVAELLERLR